ncbi:DUF2306 domain-containing protein [Paenibacillus sp. y28]|uniref:DUF2306 domain-containing protein n=1 Tax=Paenibacillus sp. y28 TaxID=3129110 RepID=UPI003017129F
MRGTTSRRLYGLLLLFTAGYMVYVVYMNFIHDPQATAFLSQKTNLTRTLHLPVWLNVMYAHVVCACIAMLSGAVNFSKRVLKRYPRLHRVNGYVYVAAVFLVCLTSGYMAPYSTGGKLNSVAFNMVNILWPGMTVVAILRIRRKQLDKHRKWMVRSYVFCFTNLFIHLITFVFHAWTGLAYDISYTFGVYGAILVNLLLAELVIRVLYRTPAPLPQAGQL